MSSSTAQPPTDGSAFTLRASPSTDIWRKPPSTNRFDAHTSLLSPTPLSKFNKARVTFSASWTLQYDQGGLLLVLGPGGGAGGRDLDGSSSQWLKTGVEYYDGAPRVSTVGCDRWADWSIAPVPDAKTTGAATGGGEVTVEVRREGDENGRSLWVYCVVLDQEGKVKERHPLREVNWFFAEEGESKGGEVMVQVGVYAARPAEEQTVAGKEEKELEIVFKGFQVE